MSQLHLLVADIGGTNARFGLVEPGQGPDQSNPQAGFLANHQITLKCAEHTGIAAMAKAYCEQLGIAIPAYACLAVAGPIEEGQVKMTNLDWSVSIEEMRQELGMKALYVINDFAALAYATPFLKPHELHSLRTGKADPEAAMVVMGPGTGFGMAALVPVNNDWKILPTEGGHCSFAPINDKELAIRQFAAQSQSHVSIEDLISGRGLVTIYKALCHRTNKTAEDLTPADVSTRAIANTDAVCRDALESFCLMLGSIAGDKALSLGAKGGVFLGGGIIPKIADFIRNTDLLTRFTQKGPMSGYLEDIPIGIIVNDKAALVGTAAWLVNHTPELHKAFYSQS